MMVRCANDGVLEAYVTKRLVNDGEMLVDDGEMSVGSYNKIVKSTLRGHNIYFLKRSTRGGDK